MIRDWTERNFEFAGYVSGFDPRTSATATSCATTWLPA
jgi:hypothetical protein